MQQKFSQRLEMQIPRENAYTGAVKMPNIDNELEKLSKYYILRKTDELKEYLKRDERLIQYIKFITPIIRKYFSERKIYLTYCIDPEFEELNDVKICVIGNDSSFEEEHELMNNLNNELLHSTEFQVEVKSLLSVRMWWL